MGLKGHTVGLTIIISVAASVLLLLASPSHAAFGDMGQASPAAGDSQDYFYVVSNSEGHTEKLRIPLNQILFHITPIYDAQGNEISYTLSLKPELDYYYKQYGLYATSNDTVFIYPSFTQAAYDHNGFYDYYKKQCDTSCLTVPIPTRISGYQASSIVGAWELKLLGFPHLKDQDVDKNPNILKQFKRVIVLHNEYVTKTEFDAITSHPDVIFLYPNALYAEVTANYDDNTITLVRGHGYPDSSIRNGFDWPYDNTKFEYDIHCDDWNFYHRGNYTMLNCYPEYKLLTSDIMIGLLQKDDPTTMRDDVANWLIYPEDKNTTEKLLDDFNVDNMHYLPPWAAKPALWLANNEITKREFGDMVQYLSEIHQK